VCLVFIEKNTDCSDTVTAPPFFNGRLAESSYDLSEGSVVAFAWWK